MKNKVVATIAAAVLLIGGVLVYENTVNKPTSPGPVASIGADHLAKSSKKPAISGRREGFLYSIFQTVGIRKKLSDERLEEAVKQWRAGTDDLTDLQISGFKTTSDILHEIEKMYQGETRFTKKRAVYLAKAAASSPSIAKEAEQYDVIFPYPVGPEVPDDIETAKAFLKGSYETFHQYIDRIVAPLPEQSRQRISLTSEQYHAAMTIVRKVDTGEPPDTDIVDAANLINRMVQDYKAPDPRGPIAKIAEEEQQRILAKWNDLLLRVEKSRVAQ